MKKIIQKCFIISLFLSSVSSCSKPMTGSIDFVLNDGVLDTTDKSIDEAYLENMFKGKSGTDVYKEGFTVPNVKKEGYYFVGWGEKCDYDQTSGVCLTTNNALVDFTNRNNYVIPYGQAKVYAIFKKEVTISFNFNQSFYDKDLKDTVVTLSGYQDKNLNAVDFPKFDKLENATSVLNHYLDNNWYTDRESKEQFKAAKFPKENITVYARWNKNPILHILAGTDTKPGQFNDNSYEVKLENYSTEDLINISDINNVLKEKKPTRKSTHGDSYMDNTFYVATKKEDGKFEYTNTVFTFGNNPIGYNDVYIYFKFFDRVKLTVNYPDSTSEVYYGYQEKTLRQSQKMSNPEFDLKSVVIQPKEINNKTFSHFEYTVNNEKVYFDENSTILDTDIVIDAVYDDYKVLTVQLNGSTVDTIKLPEGVSPLLLGQDVEGATLNDNPLINKIMESNKAHFDENYLIAYKGKIGSDGEEFDINLDSTLSTDTTINIVTHKYYKFNLNSTILKKKLSDSITYDELKKIIPTASYFTVNGTGLSTPITLNKSNPVYYVSDNKEVYDFTITPGENQKYKFSVSYQNEVLIKRDIEFGTSLNDLLDEIDSILKSKGVTGSYYFVTSGKNTEYSIPSTMPNTNIDIEVRI